MPNAVAEQVVRPTGLVDPDLPGSATGGKLRSMMYLIHEINLRNG